MRTCSRKIMIIGIAALMVLLLVFFSAVRPSNLYDEFSTSGIVTDSETWREFGETTINKKSYYFASYVSADGEYNILTVRTKGLRGNQEEMSSGSAMNLSSLENPRYEDLKAYPLDYRKVNGGYVLWYAGIVPADCTSVTIDKEKAYLKTMTLETADGQIKYLQYYLILFSDNMPEDYVDLVITSNTIGKNRIISSDLEQSRLEPFN